MTTTPETGTANPSPYEQSAQRLFALLPTPQVNHSGQFFFRAVWDEADPTTLNHVTIMSVAPTGALGTERWGEFHSAQLRLTEINATGEPAEHFVWTPTPALRPSDPIRVDADTLSRNYGYRELSPKQVLGELAARTNTVDDCLSLIKIMRQHDVAPTNDFTTLVNRLAYRFAHGLGTRKITPPEGNLEQNKMFALLQELKVLGSDVRANTQGYLVSQLLRIVHRGKAEPQIPDAAADSAAGILDTALRAEVLPDEPRIIHRILGTRRVYAYPFATELLHAKLQAEPGYGSGSWENIFRVKRIGFVAEYIATMLDRATGLHAEIEGILVNSAIRYPDAAEGQLYFMLDRLEQLFEERFRTGDTPPQARSLAEVGSDFARLLSQAAGGKKPGKGQTVLNRQSVEVVTAILKPVLQRKVGGGTVSM